MSETPLEQLRSKAGALCTACGRSRQRYGAFVIDWITEFVCESCVDSYVWEPPHWHRFAVVGSDPPMDVYVRPDSQLAASWQKQGVIKINF